MCKKESLSINLNGTEVIVASVSLLASAFGWCHKICSFLKGWQTAVISLPFIPCYPLNTYVHFMINRPR